jgi:hypothetical protein
VMMRAALPRYVPLRWDKQRNQSECFAFTYRKDNILQTS